MTTKTEQAVQIIAKEISKVEENTIMDYGTVGYALGATKREGAARGMAQTFVEMLSGKKFTGNLTDEQEEWEKENYKLAHEIEMAALEITGK